MVVGPWYGGLLNKFLNVCHFDYTAFVGIGKVGSLNLRLTTPV